MIRWLALSLLAAASCSEPVAPPPRVDTSTMEPAVARLIGARFQAVQGSPQSAAAWSQYAIALHGHDLWDEAITCYERAHSIEPANFDHPYRLAIAREMRGADVDGTLGYLAIAEGIDATYPPYFVQKGWVLARAGRNEEASDALESALSLSPDYAQAHANLGEVLLLLGDARGAREHLEAALEDEPDDRSVNAAMARALMLEGDTERARGFAERVPDLRITLADGDSILEEIRDINRTAEESFSRAKQYAAIGNWQKAEAKLRICLEERGDDVSVLSRMGHALLMLGRHADAQPFLERTIGLKPDHVVARVRLARVHAALKRPEDARREVEDALGRAPDFGEALTLRAIFFLEDGDLNSAEELFRAAERSPQGVTGDGYLRWGLALAQGSRVPEAAPIFEKFVAAQPEHGEGRYMLAIAYEQTGQIEKAIAQYEVALELAPTHAFAGRARSLIPQR